MLAGRASVRCCVGQESRRHNVFSLVELGIWGHHILRRSLWLRDSWLRVSASRLRACAASMTCCSRASILMGRAFWKDQQVDLSNGIIPQTRCPSTMCFLMAAAVLELFWQHCALNVESRPTATTRVQNEQRDVPFPDQDRLLTSFIDKKALNLVSSEMNFEIVLSPKMAPARGTTEV